MDELAQALAPADAIYEKLHRNKDDSISQTLPNCMIVLEEDPLFRDAIQFNVLSGRMAVTREMPWSRDGDNFTDDDLHNIFLYMQKTYGLTNDKRIQQAVSLVAHRHKYHPIRDCLEKLEWDGQERIRHVLHHFLGAPEDDLSAESTKVWLLGAIHRLYHPGCKFDYMLVLVGRQGAGKSSLFRFFALKDEWFLDDLKNLSDDRVFRKLAGHWIVEMSEMIATVNARSVEDIKAFLSRQKDNYKEPYAIYAEDRPRQCVFGGTTNRLQFLPFDRTGNRRFIPIIVDMEQAETHILADESASRAYIEQVWAEAMEIYRSGKFSLTFSREMELELNRLRMECMAEDTVAGRIQDYLDNLDGDYVCTLQIFKEGLDHPYDEPKRSDTNEINEIMNNVVTGWKTGPTHRFSKYGIQRSWVRVSERTAKPSLCGSAIPEERRQPDVNEGCKRALSKPKFPDDFREVDDPDNPFTEQRRMDIPKSP